MPTIDLTTLVFGLNLFLAVVLVLIFWHLGKNKKSNSRHLTEDLSLILEAEKRSNEILQTASQEAQKLLVDAELEGLSFIAKQKIEGRRVAQQHQERMADLIQAVNDRIKDQADQANLAYNRFIKDLEEKMTQDLNLKQASMDKRLDDFFGKAESLLESFVNDLQRRTQTQVDQEIGNAKKIIEEYQRKRLEVIDENIVAIIEKTLNITLGKKLTLADQTELVYEALEEAKKENFFE